MHVDIGIGSKLRFSYKKYNNNNSHGNENKLEKQRSDLATSTSVKNKYRMNDSSNLDQKSKKSTSNIPKVKISGKSASDCSIVLSDQEKNFQHSTKEDDHVHITEVSEKLNCASTSTFNADDTGHDDDKHNFKYGLAAACHHNDSVSVDNVNFKPPFNKSDSRTSFINNRLSNLRRSISDVKRGKDAEIISALDEMNVKTSDINSPEKSSKRFSTVNTDPCFFKSFD